ncbi:MAG: putative hydrolase or acyltransferase of alpha/beta superfamily [Myxococcales bacterium]|nr:putative hydrolase or acyltransferase of alpha/beta superfamily [Myxococcales bacterium]
MHVMELGRGPAVMIIHGSPAPIADLLPLAERLAVAHHVLIPELPGFGRTPPDTEISSDRICDGIAAILRARGHSAPRAIIGFSSGGYRALDLALRRNITPELVVGLAALATLEDADRAMFRAFAASIRADPSCAQIRPMLPGRWLSDAWRRAHPEDDARVTAWIDLTTPQHLAAELEAQANMLDLRPLLPSLGCPLYLRVGELDLACPPPVSVEMARLAPRATVDVVPGCGHALLVENAAATIQRVVDVVTNAGLLLGR